MRKYIFTESQLKNIIDSQINEQTSQDYEGVIKMVNGKTMVIATTEMGNTKKFSVTLKTKVADGIGVFVKTKNGKVEIYGGKPTRKLN